VSVSRGLGFKRPASKLILLGKLHERLGGSEYAKLFFPDAVLEAPVPDLTAERSIVDSLLQGIADGSVLSAHDISQGGLLVALAEMMTASAPFPLGCEVDLSGALPAGATFDRYAFSEFGGIVAEVDAVKWDALAADLSRRKTPWVELGRTAEAPVMSVRWEGGRLDVAFADADSARRIRNRFNPLFA
jgi:phosphoribosylformylglycinamidine synthase